MITDIIKTSAPNKTQPKLTIPFFQDKPSLCVASTLLHYINRTANLRGNIEVLFLTYKKPHHVASVQSISRWIKSALAKSGVNTHKFNAYSTRHAYTFTAYNAGLNINTIRHTTGWTPNSQTFFKFYNKPLNASTELAKSVILRK